jgi:hypothetical protein
VPISQNGFPASEDANSIGITTVTLASGKTFRAASSVAPNLQSIAEWWASNIEPITQIGGYNFREIRGYEGSGKYSNHASGTAIDINWDKHPLGARGTVTPDQAEAIRKKAAELGLRWGGDYRSRADEMHFEVNVPPSEVPAIYAGYTTRQLAGMTAATVCVGALIGVIAYKYKQGAT